MTNRSESKKKRSRLRPTKGAREAAKRLAAKEAAAVEETAAADETATVEDAAFEEMCTDVGGDDCVTPTRCHSCGVACQNDEVPCQ